MNKRKLGQLVLGCVGLALGIIAVVALREATLSTHGAIDPDSRVEVLLDVRTRHREPGQTVAESVEALLLTCRLEVSSDVVGPIRDVGNGRFRAVLQPALDETNRKQLRGCLEDWTIDSVHADVVSLERVS
jgi:hypothetical protein